MLSDSIAVFNPYDNILGGNAMKQRTDNKIVIEMRRLDWESVTDALDYAIEERRYDAAHTHDDEDRATIEACAGKWDKLRDIIAECMAMK